MGPRTKASFGAEGTTFGEAVFSTCMTGYQEMLTDPSFAGQLAHAHVPADRQLRRRAAGLRVEEGPGRRGSSSSSSAADRATGAATGTLEDFLAGHGIVGIQGIDTRALTKHLQGPRRHDGRNFDRRHTRGSARRRSAEAPNYGNIDFVKRVSTDKPYVWRESSEGAEAECTTSPWWTAA